MRGCATSMVNVFQGPHPRINTVEDPELKAIDHFTISRNPIPPLVPWQYTVNGTFILLNNITNGPGLNQRIGTVVRLKRVQLLGSIINYIPDSLNIGPVRCRTLIVWDKDANSGLLNSTSLFQDPTFPASSPLNLDNRAEHVIIMDHLWCSGYIHRNISNIQTFWTKQTVFTENWATSSWPGVAANPGAGLAVPPPVVVPNIDLNNFKYAVCQTNGGDIVNPDLPVNNSVITFAAAGKNHKKMKKDYFIDLWTVFKSQQQDITTGALWLVLVRDPEPVIGSNEFVLEASVRVRYADK